LKRRKVLLELRKLLKSFEDCKANLKMAEEVLSKIESLGYSNNPAWPYEEECDPAWVKAWTDNVEPGSNSTTKN
jgi:hypothetical protein